MQHIQEFNRFAKSYEEYKIIQKRVAAYLIQKTALRPKYILDLGAGSGEVYRHIYWPFEKFYALDAASNMLFFHPMKRVEKIVCNFDEEECWKKIEKKEIDHIFSSSALQWSKDLEKLMINIKKIDITFSFALFTSNTFKTLHQLLGITSPIYSKEEILEIVQRYFMINYEVREYKLFFPQKEDIFFYIKRSGVSSGRRMARFCDLKRVMKEYPLNYLEFEVVFLWSKK